MVDGRVVQPEWLRLLRTVQLLSRVQVLALLLDGVAGVGVLWAADDALGWRVSWTLGLLLLLSARVWLVRARAGVDGVDKDDLTAVRSWLWWLRWTTLLAGLLWAIAALFACCDEMLLLALMLSAITLSMVALDRLAVVLCALPFVAVMLTLVLTDRVTVWYLLIACTLVLLHLLAIRRWSSGQLTELIALKAELASGREAGAVARLHAQIAQANKDLLFLDWRLDEGHVDCSPCWCEILGERDDDLPSTVDGWCERIHSDDLQVIDNALRHHLHNCSLLYHYEYRLRCCDGSYKWLSASGQVVKRGDAGEPLRRVEVHLDISARHCNGDLMHRRQGLMIADSDEKILAVNSAFSEITGYSRHEAIGQTPRLIKSGVHDPAFYKRMWALLLETGSWQGEIWNRRKSGQIYQEWLEVHVLNDDGRIYYIGTLHDIGERRAAEEAAQHLAFHDPLTALPNRRLLLERLEQMLLASQRSGHFGALLYIDLDRFKELNDSMGHATGDLLLQAIAGRLRQAVRAEDTVARFGGDEFVILLGGLGSDQAQARQHALEIGSTLHVVLRAPYLLAGHHYTTTPSIGILPFQGADIPTEELLHRADLAMYEAKRSGRDCVRLFQVKMHRNVAVHNAMLKDMRCALDRCQLTLNYQPQIDGTGEMLGVEALLRWNSPSHGPMKAESFIQLAEESGLILPFGRWVLEQGCQQLAYWSGSASCKQLSLSLNVSAREFQDAQLFVRLGEILDEGCVPASRLTLELNESVLLHHSKREVEGRLHPLVERGVGLSLDNFASRRASLNELMAVQIGQIKLDRHLVARLLQDFRAAAIVRNVIMLAHDLGLTVVGCGIEHDVQHELLVEYGCDLFQGNLFNPPLPLDDLAAIVAVNSPGRPTVH